MTGVVLETLSTKKLLAFTIVLLILHVVFFLIGGLIAPAPNATDQILTSKCIDRSKDPMNNKDWFYTRPRSNSSCKEILPDGDFTEIVPKDVTAAQIVFVAQFPVPKSNYELKMTKWFQQLIAILMIDIKYKSHFEMLEDSTLTLDVRLGFRNQNDADHEWKELAHSTETRPLKCKLDPDALRHANHSHSLLDGYYYDCEVLPLFTLGSVYYDYYLVNIRLPADAERQINTKISSLQDLWLVEIHQNGGFTKVWFSLKTFTFPCLLAALLFFSGRINELDRAPTLLERVTLAMGIVLSCLNFPLEWMSLVVNVPFWLILSDIRQGAFYAVLVCFWLVFTSEHSMNGGAAHSQHRSGILARLGLAGQYWPKLILLAGTCSGLFIFELAERGVQLQNPFYSIWSHPNVARLGYGSVVFGGICAAVYLIYLGYLVGKAFFSMVNKRRMLHSLPEERRKYYSGVIYRFSILLGYTLFCAFMTVVFFICSQLNEDQWKWGQHSLEYGSAFITGVYGMWNIYVFAVLCLYAPSHKFRSEAGQQLFNQLITSQSEASCTSLDHQQHIQMQEMAPNTGFSSSALQFIQKTAFE